MNATKARANFFQIVRDMETGSEPIVITGKEHNVVIMPEEDWKEIDETAYIGSIPGMKKYLTEMKDAPDEEFVPEEEVRW